MKRRTKVTLGVIGVVAVAGVAATAFSFGGGNGDDGGRTVEVRRGTIVDKALAVGRIEPDVEISVKSQISGVVKRRFAEVGDHVRAGQPLLEIQPNPTPLELVEARRELELREIELGNIQKERDRLSALRENDFVSQQEFETVDRQFEQARTQQLMARERLALLEQGKVVVAGQADIETVVKSPITGFILEKTVDIGDPVVPLTSFQEGTVLMTMAEMDELIFRGTVDEIDVGRLEEGMPATIKIGALPDARVDGVVEKISLKGQEQDNATVFPVEIAVLPAEGVTLRAGYSANADVIIEKREDVLVIPERLITYAADTARVTVGAGGEATEERIIATGLSDGIDIEVVEGLDEGEVVFEKPPREIQ
jgi:HlyD family secretion protein